MLVPDQCTGRWSFGLAWSRFVCFQAGREGAGLAGLPQTSHAQPSEQHFPRAQKRSALMVTGEGRGLAALPTCTHETAK